MLNNVSVPFSLSTAVEIGWSPGELRGISPHAFVLERDGTHVEIPYSLLSRVRHSMIFAPFESLRWFMRPLRGHSDNILSDISISVTNTSSRSERRKFWSDSGDKVTITVVFPGSRSFTVRRGVSDLRFIIETVNTLFPEILFPLPPNHLDIVCADVLCSCIQFNIRALDRFMPILFFLIEENESFFSKHVAQTKDALQLLRNGFTIAEKRTWFRWSTPPAPANKPLSEIVKQFNLSHTVPLLSSDVSARLRLFRDLQEETEKLVRNWQTEEEAIVAVADAFTRDDLLSSVLEPWCGETASDAFEVPAIPLRQSSSLLDMLLQPVSYVEALQAGLESCIQRIVELEKLHSASNASPEAMDWASNNIRRIDTAIPEQQENVSSRIRQAFVQLCVLIHCISRHHFD